MAINPSSSYAGKIASDPTNYPYGKARNVTVSGDATGTPWEAALVNDIFGFQQRLLSLAGITPSGTPDGAVTSQYFEAIWKLWNQRSVTHDMASDADYSLTADQNLYGRLVITDTGATLTTGRNIAVDDVERQIIVQNLTLQTLTFKTSGGTGVAVPAGGYRVVRNDGTNVVASGVRTGFKNLVINGSKSIQQRGTTGGRRQVIDAQDLPFGGNATISFTGTATVRVYQAAGLGATDAATSWTERTSGASGPGVTVTLTAGQHTKIEFSTTSFSAVQLELGDEATELEYRPYQTELDLCKWFYQKVTIFLGSTAYQVNSSWAPFGKNARGMRITPTYSTADTGGATLQINNPGGTVQMTQTSAPSSSQQYIVNLNAEHFTDTYYEDRWF